MCVCWEEREESNEANLKNYHKNVNIILKLILLLHFICISLSTDKLVQPRTKNILKLQNHCRIKRWPQPDSKI